MLLLLLVVVGGGYGVPASAQSALDSYDHKRLYNCWGPGSSVDIKNGKFNVIREAILSAVNSSEVACTNPGSYNNVYTFNRREGLALWFDCQSVTNCGGNPTFVAHMTCTANSTYIPAKNGCVCNTGYMQDPSSPNTCVQVVESNDAQKEPKDRPCGNPVYALTGTKREPLQTGVSVGGMPLVLTYDSTSRTPANQAVSASVLVDPPGFGELWKSSLHRRLLVSADLKKALISRGNGTILYFDGNGSGTFTALADNPHKLVRVTGGYLFSDTRAGAVETYDTDGKLAQIAAANGRVLGFAYSGDKLMSVQSNDGRGVRFAYGTSGLVSQATDAAGAVTAMDYDANGNLISVTWPGGKVVRFVYENPALPWALTGKIDENNGRYSTFTYDSEGRAISTEHAGGVNKFSFSHGTPPQRIIVDNYDAQAKVLYRAHSWQVPSGTTITYPNGETVAIEAASVAGMPAPTGRSQPAGSGCAASTSASTYDSAGNVLSRDDFQGSRTCYAYDSSNRETVRIEGLSSSVACSSVISTGATLPGGARKITTSWHPDWAMPVQRTQPLRKSTTVYHAQPDPTNSNTVASCTAAAAMPGNKPVPLVCRQVEQALLSDGTPDPAAPSVATSYAYDALGRVVSSTNPRGKTTTYAYYAGGSAHDPHHGAVSLLLRGNGTNGSTTVTDDSPVHRSVTPAGDAKVSTAQSRFGGSALAFDGAGDYLTIPSSSDFDFDAGDFTIEMWIRTVQTTAYAVLLNREWGAAPHTGSFTLFLNHGASGPLSIYWADHSTTAPFLVGSTTTQRDGTWRHIAWTRNGNVHRLFDNGVQVGTATSSIAFASANKNLTVGTDLTFGGGARAYNGHIDDLRITKGVARYTANFTPPIREAAPAGPDMADSGYAVGDLQTITNAQGHVTSFLAYDPAGRVRQMTDAKGVVTDITYTPRGWVSSVVVTPPADAARTTTYTYDDAGQLTQVSQPDGTALNYSYDAAHRLVGVTDARGNAVTYTLDNAGNRVGDALRDPTGTLQRSIARSFDALNRLQQVIGASK
jgi:YD repeat-containing protein